MGIKTVWRVKNHCSENKILSEKKTLKEAKMTETGEQKWWSHMLMLVCSVLMILRSIIISYIVELHSFMLVCKSAQWAQDLLYCQLLDLLSSISNQLSWKVMQRIIKRKLKIILDLNWLQIFSILIALMNFLNSKNDLEIRLG